MSETERAVEKLLEMTDLHPKLKPINAAGNLCVEVSNPLGRLSRNDRMRLAERVQQNLLELSV